MPNIFEIIRAIQMKAWIQTINRTLKKSSELINVMVWIFFQSPFQKSTDFLSRETLFWILVHDNFF